MVYSWTKFAHVIGLQLGDMMKRIGRLGKISNLVTSLFLLAVILVASGCGAYTQPGETAAERGRRHRRILRVNHHQMVDDIDKLLNLDRPSRLSDRRLP